MAAYCLYVCLRSLCPDALRQPFDSIAAVAEGPPGGHFIAIFTLPLCFSPSLSNCDTGAQDA